MHLAQSCHASEGWHPVLCNFFIKNIPIWIMFFNKWYFPVILKMKIKDFFKRCLDDQIKT